MPGIFLHGYALLAGVGKTAHAEWPLPATVLDAQAIRAILADPALCAYPKNGIRLLHDSTATGGEILEGLAWLAGRAEHDPEAAVLIYYSGHGALDQATGCYYLIPYDTDPGRFPETALSALTFTDALRRIPAQRLLVILDCCHAAGMATAKESRPAIKLPAGFIPAAVPKGLTAGLKQGSGRAVFTSSRGEQLSWLRPDGGMSIYTYHLCEALRGAGNKPGDTLVRLSNLMNHLGTSVPASARALCGAEQTPFFDTATEDFPVALLRGGKGLPAAERVTASMAPPCLAPVSSVVQEIGSVQNGGAVIGILQGDQAQIGGTRHYGDIVHGDKIGGDKAEGNKVIINNPKPVPDDTGENKS